MQDGNSIVLERQPGADTGGYAGLEDEVDNHWGMLFKAAVLSTMLSVGAEAGTSQNENNLVQAIRSGASNSISQTGQQIVNASLSAGNLRATLLDHRHRFPEVDTYLVDGSSDNLISELANSAIDVAVVAEPNPRWSDRSLTVWSERVVAALPENHPLTRRDVFTGAN